jgi:recombination protein RecT
VIAALRRASTVCLLKDNSEGIEILMVKRGHDTRVMADAWVFPGGGVDAIDETDLARDAVEGEFSPTDQPWVAAALREVAEEVDIWLTRKPVPPTGSRVHGAAVFHKARDLGLRFDGRRLAYFANWVTPTMIPIRFDTRFYAAQVDAGSQAAPDPAELSAAEWILPARAIELFGAGDRVIPFPTMKVLEHMAGFADVAGFMGYVGDIDQVVPVQARARIDAAGNIETVLPGDPGYELLGDASLDATSVSEAALRALMQGHLAEPRGHES